MIRIDHHLRLPAGQTENRDGSGRESGRFRAFRLMITRSTGGWNPAWRGDFRQEKGPGDYPSPCGWWRRRLPNSHPNVLKNIRSRSLKVKTCPHRCPQIGSADSPARFRPILSSSGARHASNRSSASVLSIRAHARRSRSIVRSRFSSGKSCARRSASAKNASSRLASDQASMTWSSSSLLSFRAFAARRASSSRRHCSR